MSSNVSSGDATLNMTTWSMLKFVGTNLLALATLGALAAGCGSDGTITVAGEDLEIVEIAPAGASTQLVEFTSSALGGVRFSIDPAHHLYTRGDTIVVSIEDPAGEASWETASIGLVTQTADGIPIETVDQVLDLIESVPSADLNPTGTAIQLFGHDLAGYDIRADASTQEHLIVAADRFGSPPFALFGYTPNARIFIGQTPAGVLVAASQEADEPSSLDDIDVALGTLLATIELTSGSLDEPLPQAQTLEPDSAEDSTARGELDANAPAALDAVFSPVEAGTYQLANFGPTFTLEFEDDWFVQPNFPGIIVLTGLNSGGPGDRDLVFLTGMVDMVPIVPGPVAAGEPIPVVTADDVINAISANLDVSGREEVDLDGLAATRFDVRAPADALCTEADPCQLAFRNSSGSVTQLNPTQAHRIWWIEQGAEGPSMILAMAPVGHDFSDNATALLSTLEFNS